MSEDILRETATDTTSLSDIAELSLLYTADRDSASVEYIARRLDDDIGNVRDAMYALHDRGLVKRAISTHSWKTTNHGDDYAESIDREEYTLDQIELSVGDIQSGIEGLQNCLDRDENDIDERKAANIRGQIRALRAVLGDELSDPDVE